MFNFYREKVAKKVLATSAIKKVLKVNNRWKGEICQFCHPASLLTKLKKTWAFKLNHWFFSESHHLRGPMLCSKKHFFAEKFGAKTGVFNSKYCFLWQKIGFLEKPPIVSQKIGTNLMSVKIILIKKTTPFIGASVKPPHVIGPN
jgi:hypothetical protein